MTLLHSERKTPFQPIIYFSIWKKKGYLSVLEDMRHSVCMFPNTLFKHISFPSMHVAAEFCPPLHKPKHVHSVLYVWLPSVSSEFGNPCALLLDLAHS